MNETLDVFKQLRNDLAAGAMIEHKVDGKLHKVNGPACIWKIGNYSGWALFGECHRYYGPAASLIGNVERWWLHGDLIK